MATSIISGVGGTGGSAFYFLRIMIILESWAAES